MPSASFLLMIGRTDKIWTFHLPVNRAARKLRSAGHFSRRPTCAPNFPARAECATKIQVDPESSAVERASRMSQRGRDHGTATRGAEAAPAPSEVFPTPR